MKLTIAVVDLLNKHMKKREYPTMAYKKFLFKDGSFEMRQEVKVDFGLVVFYCSDEILQLSEFIDCAEYMIKNRTIRRDFRVVDKDGKPVEKLPLDAAWISPLRPFLVTYFNELGSLTFDEEGFGDLYLKLERYVYTQVQKYNVSSPLLNFSLETDEIDLGKGLRIRQISDEERMELFESDAVEYRNSIVSDVQYC